MEPQLTFWHVAVYNSAGAYCDWHYLATARGELPSEYTDAHDRVTSSDKETFVSSYNPRGVTWPQSIRHVYTSAAKKESAQCGQSLGGVVLLGA